MTSGAAWGACFTASPKYSNPQEIHHIIFANNVANGCQGSGITSANRGVFASVDYLAVVGNIIYHAAQSNTECYSGISIYQPIQSDWQAGTHIYVAGNLSYGSMDPDPCGGSIPYDGEGIIFDTLDGSQGGMHAPYGAQVLAENNILIGNGGRGLEVGHNDAGSPPNATVYIRHNTIWGNNRDVHQNSTGCGELNLNRTTTTIATFNLVATSSPTGCGYNIIYPLSVTESTGSVQVTQNFAYSVNGANLESWDNGSFSYGSTNTVGINPSFADPYVPGAPYCAGTSSAAACMATVVANFKPRAASAAGYGFQTPGTSATYDPLYPQWLCNVNLPPGLVKNGC
jgi:serralysin